MTDAVRDYIQSEAARTQGTPLTDTIKRQPKNFRAAQPADPDFVKEVPLDHRPEALGEDDGTIAWRKGFDALEALYGVHEKIVGYAITINDKAALAKAVEPAVTRALAAMNRELEGLDSQLNYWESEIKTALGSGVSPLAAETRAILRELPESERLGFCRNLLANGETEALKAVASVPAYMSGLTSEAHSWVKEEAELRVAYKSVMERRVGFAARTRMQRARDYFQQTMTGNLKRWHNSDDQKIANLTKVLK